MPDDFAHKAFETASSPGGVSALGAAIGWACYRLMNTAAKLDWRRFVFGCAFAAFSGWVLQALLVQYAGIPVDNVAPIAAGLGSVAEKLRSIFIKKLEEKINGK